MVGGAKPWKLFSTIHIAIIFFCFGVTLETSELKSAFKSWQVLLMGYVMIMIGTALTGFIPLMMNFKPAAFGIGMAVFACCPTSLSQGVTVVIQGYGNAALALLLVVLTNLSSIVLTPVFVKLVLGGMDVSLDAVDLLVKMIVSILVPLLVGKGMRELLKPVREFVTKYRLPIYMFTNFQVICIVWETMSSSQEGLLAREAGEIVGACLAAVLQHMAFLVINTLLAWFASFFFRMKEAERKAFIIMASQKSLPTAVIIISYMGGGGDAHISAHSDDHELAALPPAPWSIPMAPPPSPISIDEQIEENALDPGLMAIPCIVFYVLQLFIDAFIATGWASKFEKVDHLRAKYAKELDELANITAEGSAIDVAGHVPSSSSTAALAGHSPSRPDLKGEKGADDEEGVGLLSRDDRS